MTSTILELALENDTIPLSKRVEYAIDGKTGKVKTYDHWGKDMDSIVDPNTGFTALMAAAKAGNVVTIEVLINRGADPNFRSERSGRSALHIAAKYGQPEAIHTLLDLGALVNSMDNIGGTALMHCCKSGYDEIARQLIRRGAGVNLTDRNGWAAIHYCSKFGHKAVCEILVSCGAALGIQDSKEGKTPLMYASQFGRRETLRVLLSSGVDVNAASAMDGITALMLACREGHKGIVVDLLESGADPNLASYGGWSALLFAAAAGRKDTSAILLRKGGVDVNFSDERSGGLSALTVASRSGQASVVKLLLDLGATIDAADVIAGMTPLMHASRHDAARAIACLIDHKANLNLRDKRGMTPLMHACIAGSSEAIVELVNSFADINVTDREVKSAFDHALIHGHRSLFLSALINVDAAAKVPFVSWLERECPKMKRGTDLGNPSVYLNAFLYGSNGLYAGLYLRSREYDFELVSSLVMLAAAFKRAAEADSQSASDMLSKLNDVDNMIMLCLQARSMVADESVANSLLLHTPPVFRTEFNLLELTPALTSGPLALYADINQHKMLRVPAIEDKISLLLRTCSRLPPVGFRGGPQKSASIRSILGSLSSSPWLRIRYIPIAMLIMSEGSKALVLFLICVSASDPTYEAPCQMIVLMTVLLILYELGLMEDKLNGDWPSILLDRSVLIQRRWQNVCRHFVSDVWKVCDSISYLLLVLWVLSWMNSGLRASQPILALSAIPLSFGLMRVPAVVNNWLGEIIFGAIEAMRLVIKYFVVVAFTGLGVGVAVFSMFHELYGFSTGGRTLVSLFQVIYSGLDLQDLDESNRYSVGVSVLCIFSVWISTALFSLIVAHLANIYADLTESNSQKLVLWRTKLLQTYSLVNERSPLCTLPAPLNIITAAAYIPHYTILQGSQLIPGRSRHLSLSGWLGDIVLCFMFLPVAYGTSFYSTLLSSSFSRWFKLGGLLLSPLFIALNTIVLALTFGWLPAAVYLLPNKVKWSRMHRICYEDRRDCIIKIGLPEAAMVDHSYKEPPEVITDDEGGYIGYVDMNERNFHYYAMLLAWQGIRQLQSALAVVMRIRRYLTTHPTTDEDIGRADSSPSRRSVRLQSDARRRTMASDDQSIVDSDDEDSQTYNEIGAPIDKKATGSVGLVRDIRIAEGGQSGKIIPAYADDSAHYEVPQHTGTLYSLTERQRIFGVVIPDLVQSVDLTHPTSIHPSNKTVVEVHASAKLLLSDEQESVGQDSMLSV